MSAEDAPIRLRAFVGRSFLDADDSLWREVEAVLKSLRSLGFVFEDAKAPQPRPVSEKVREAIKRNDIYIGILSRRSALCDATTMWSRLRRTTAWSTSGWVVQEAGYALGRDKPILLLIEDGVDFPTANLDADTEWIQIVRGAVASISTKLVAMLGQFIAARLPEEPTAQLTAAAPPAVPPTDAPEEGPSAEALAATEAPNWSDVVALVEAARSSEADVAFDQFKGSLPDALKEWFGYNYLEKKATAGDDDSLRKLQETVATAPENVDARFSLANYYYGFQNLEKAVAILSAGVEAAPDRRRPVLRRRIATLLAEAGKFKEAYNVIADAALAQGDDERLYVCLADVAKRQGDNELQAAALEKALTIGPAVPERRLRLGYLYGEMNKDRLALFHYKLRLAQGNDAVALNNLGVSLAALKLESREVESYEAASADSPLAKANLSHAYVDRGLLKNAEDLAHSVVRSGDSDEQSAHRAAAALQRIASKRETERQNEEQLVDAARAEAAFRADYAVAFLQPVVSVSGVFQTPYGDLVFTQTASSLEGKGQFTEASPASIFSSLVSGAQPQSVKVRSVLFKAELVGRSGHVTLTIGAETQGTLLVPIPSSSTTRGLVVVAPDGQTLNVLEETDQKVKLYQAVKLGEA